VNRDQDIGALLSRAVAIVGAADIPDDLRSVAFSYACTALEARPRPSDGDPSSPEAYDSHADSLLPQIAQKLGVDHDTVTAVFEEDDGDIVLILPKNMLPNTGSKASSMRDIALLVAAGRQAAGLEDYTSLSLVRKECEELGVLDANNFATEVGRLGMRAQGGRNSREVRASRHQLEQAAALMRDITSE
jgi:hypothetical protein